VILTYLFSAKVTSPRKNKFVRYIRSICEKTARDIEITLMKRYQEIGHGPSNDTRTSSPLPPSPSFGHGKRENRIFRFHLMKLRCKVVPTNNFQQHSCSSLSMSNIFHDCLLKHLDEELYELRFLHRFQCTTRYGAVFPKQLHRFACVIHRWQVYYTVKLEASYFAQWQ